MVRNQILLPGALAVVVIIAIASLGLPVGSLFPWLQSQKQAATGTASTPSVTVSPDDAAARTAALAGTQAFYTVDYQKGQQAWLDALCSASTENGCYAYQAIFAPKLWQGFEQAKTSTTAAVTADGQISTKPASSKSSPTQIWKLQVHLSAPWPQQKEPQVDFAAHALVVKEKGVWKFERLLTDEEVQAIK